MEIRSDNPEHGFQFPGEFEIFAQRLTAGGDEVGDRPGHGRWVRGDREVVAFREDDLQPFSMTLDEFDVQFDRQASTGNITPIDFTGSLTVTNDGYRDWRVSGVRVDNDECHVITRSLTARLAPA